MTEYLLTGLRERLRSLPDDGTSPTAVPAALAAHLTPVHLYKRSAPSRNAVNRLEYEFLAALAYSGWSSRWALRDAVNNSTRMLHPRSGNFAIAYRHLRQAGLWEEREVRLVRHNPVLVRLTPKGGDLLAAVGVPAIPSEWEQIEARHSGAADKQVRHTTAICLFADYARKRGWTTDVCPILAHGGPTEPDIALTRGPAREYVEVQLWGGEIWRHAQKWRNQYNLQGYTAIVALSSKLAARLAAEAQTAGVPAGRITDLSTLVKADGAELWTHYWSSATGSLSPYPGGPLAPLAAPVN